jgi:hypothetical protein
MKLLLLVMYLSNGDIAEVPVDSVVDCETAFQQVVKYTDNEVKYNNQVINLYTCVYGKDK